MRQYLWKWQARWRRWRCARVGHRWTDYEYFSKCGRCGAVTIHHHEGMSITVVG